METLIKVQNLSKYYKAGKRKINEETDKMEPAYLKAVDDVSLSVYKGEILGIVGESGCGKSTLGRCIMKLIDSTKGSIAFKGDNIVHHHFNQMKPYRRQMQMIFQNPFSSFNPKQTIGKNIGNVAKFYKIPKKKYNEQIAQLLEYIGLPLSTLKRHPNELSGGQLQRLAIIRALLLNPEFIMADEPVSALDVSVQAQILNLILDLKEKYQMTMMFISHELTVVEHICDRVAVMYLGTIVEMGTTEQLFKNTLHPYTKTLLSAKPKELPELEVERMMLKGDVPSAMNIPSGCRFHTRCPYAIENKCNIEVPKFKEVEEGHYAACHLNK